MIAVVEGEFNWLKHNNMFPSASPSFALIFPCSEEWNLEMQRQTKIWMLPLGESTTKSKVSGQASQKEDSKKFKGRGGRVDGTMMTWTHSVRK